MVTGGKGVGSSVAQWKRRGCMSVVQLPQTCEDEFNLRTCKSANSLGQDWVLLNLLLGTNPELSYKTEFDEAAHANAYVIIMYIYIYIYYYIYIYIRCRMI